MPAKIAVIYYSLYGHTATLAQTIKQAIEETPGVTADLYQVAETLPEEVLTKMHAPPKNKDIPVITASELTAYDGFVFGIPTRYGRAVAQMSQFFDSTGQLWGSGALVGKFVTFFTGSSSQHGGQETTTLTTVPFAAHHGLITVFPGYQAKELTDNTEIVGGSAYGAASLSSGDGSRAVSDKEKAIAATQGKFFAKVVSTYTKGASSAPQITAAVASTETAAAPKELPTTEAVKPTVAAPVAEPVAEPVTGYSTEPKQAAAPTSAEKPQSNASKGGLFSCCSSGANKNFEN